MDDNVRFHVEDEARDVAALIRVYRPQGEASHYEMLTVIARFRGPGARDFADMTAHLLNTHAIPDLVDLSVEQSRLVHGQQRAQA